MSRKNKGSDIFSSVEYSAEQNKAAYIDYRDRLVQLALSMFEWQNVPNFIDIRYLEEQLFFKGKAVFFKDDDLGEDGKNGYVALQCIDGGGFDVYGIPHKRRGKGYNSYLSRELTDEDSVIIYNNYLHKGSFLTTELFAQKLWRIERAIDVNTNAQKTPILLQGKESQRLTLKNLYMQYDGNQPVIYGTEKLDNTGFTVLKTDAPFVADRLYSLKIMYWNEYLTHIGISNTAFQKRERLVSDEVVRSMGATIASRYNRLDPRREACKKINEIFGLNMWVDYKEDYRTFDITKMVEGETDTRNAGNTVDMIANVGEARKLANENNG